MHYWVTAVYTPKVIRKVKVKSTWCLTTVYWIGVIVSIVLPLVLGYYSSILVPAYWYDKTSPYTAVLIKLSTLSSEAVAVWTNVIGMVMIASVIKIYRFMRTLPRYQRIDVSSLLTHSGAFGLYMLCQFV